MMDRRTLLKLISAAMAAPGGVSLPVLARESRFTVGLNLAGPQYWTTEHAFNNLATNASRWRLQRNRRPFTWDEPLPPMTEDGYPLSVPEDTYLESFLIETTERAHLTREMTVLYDGKGYMHYYAGAVLLKRTPGKDYIRLHNKSGRVTAQLFQTNADDPLRNLRLYEQANSDTSLFRKPFLERLSGMKTIRFMDWLQTNNSTVRQWKDRVKPGYFAVSETGLPLETAIALANTAGITPWFNIPHLADDEYVRNFAEMVRDTLDPSLPVYVEYSNEVWNTIFEQANHAAREGQRLKLSDDEFHGQLLFYSQRSSEVIAIFERVFGDDASRVLGVYAAQAGIPWTSDTVLSWKDAAKHADVLAIAPYFGGSLGSPEQGPAVADWSLDRLFAALEEEVAGPNKALMRAHADIAAKHNVALVAYEGGQHLAGHLGEENNDRLTELFIAANRDPRMGDLYRRYLANWRDAGGGVMTLYNSVSRSSKWGSWGLLENEAQQTSPKWDAVNRLLRA